MKKIKILVGAILRGAFILAPGVAFGWWSWDKASALISILASIGVEALYLFVFSFLVVAIDAHRKQKKAEKVADEAQSVTTL